MGTLRPFANRVLLDELLVRAPVDDALHEDAGRMDLIRIELARLDQNLDLRHGDAPGGRHVGIEVAGGLSIDEIALGIALPSLDERDVGHETRLEHISLAVHHTRFLALRHDRAGAGPGEEGVNARTPGA